MMKTLLSTCAVVSLLTIPAPAMAVKFYFVAQNNASCEVFSGQVNNNVITGHARTKFYLPDGHTCDGHSSVTYYPPFKLFGCAGQRGVAPTVCTDGRSMDMHWEAISCTQGMGSGTDNFGNQYQFTFGHTAQEAVERVNQIRQHLGCEEIQVNGAQLELHGRVLPTED